MVDAIMSRKRQIVISKDLWKWGLANLAAALFLFLEAHAASFHLFFEENSAWRVVCSRLETLVLVILITNGFLDLYNHFFPFGMTASSTGSFSSEMPLSPLQMKLFGIKENDPGFKKSTPAKPVDKKEQHPFGFSPPLNGSFISPQSKSQLGWTNTGLSTTTMYMSSLDSSSWVYQPSRQTGQQRSPPASEGKRDSLRPRVSANGTFTDERSLREYLKEYDAWERTHDASTASHDASATNQTSPSFWKGTSSNNDQGTKSGIQDFSSLLKKVAYQLSTPMPFSPDSNGSGVGASRSHNKGINDAKSESLCLKLGIDPMDLVFWMQNIRIWISQTILARVVAQIDATNSKLTKVGLNDSLIGHVGIERLKKCAALPQVHGNLPELNNLLVFLNISIHQEYLVQRLRELADGGAMSEYKWLSGGRFKGNNWSDKLPTDAELIMGCFAAYMDTRLPANYRNTTIGPHATISTVGNGSSHFIEDKPFTGVYFVRLPEASSEEAANSRGKDSLLPKAQSPGVVRRERSISKAHEQQVSLTSSKRSIIVLQTCQRPPHFLLQVDGKDKMEISPGRNNLFHTLLFFLHHVKAKESGMLGRINLGPSGINVLWVID
jgi:hypothetical protein